MIDVSIIIINYNTWQITQACIESIFEYTYDINFEIILVDNNSLDKSKEIFSKDNRITYLYQDKNLGFGKANNIGFDHSKGKYLFLLNSDTLLRSNAVKEFFDYMETLGENIACIGTIMVDMEGNPIASFHNFKTFWSGFKTFTILGIIGVKLHLLKHNKPKIINNCVDSISGADLFLRKEIVQKYGLFDPDFFMYYEETEMQFRYKKHGYKSMIYNVPQIIHLEGFSVSNKYKTYDINKKALFLNSYFLYLKKTCNPILYYIYRFTFAIISPLWIFYYRFNLSDRIAFIRMYFKQTKSVHNI